MCHPAATLSQDAPRAGPGNLRLEPDPGEVDVQGFIDSSSIRQVKLLRDIALGLEEKNQ
jgi:hypothetical protein